jgi:hypothetical protein
MSEIGEECSLCGRQCDPGILLDRVCPWCYNPAPPASDDVREIVAKARGCGIREYADGVPEVAFTMTDDAAAALITAHVAKQTAALTAKVERMRQWANKRRFDFDDLIGLADEMASPRS